jgi:hypothetical protein
MPRPVEKTFPASYCSMSMYANYGDGRYYEGAVSSRQTYPTEKPKRRRHRPNAAQKERERQRVFREAFATLRGHLPLESSKKIPKRDILRLATQYIKYLTNLLHQPAVCYLIEGNI